MRIFICSLTEWKTITFFRLKNFFWRLPWILIGFCIKMIINVCLFDRLRFRRLFSYMWVCFILLDSKIFDYNNVLDIFWKFGASPIDFQMHSAYAADTLKIFGFLNLWNLGTIILSGYNCIGICTKMIIILRLFGRLRFRRNSAIDEFALFGGAVKFLIIIIC